MVNKNMIDYKAYLKSIRLSNAQKRLFNALIREPTPHLHSSNWQRRHQLTSGGTRSALRRLVSLGLIAKIDGFWRVADRGMEKWWKKVLEEPLGTSDPEEFNPPCGQSNPSEAESVLAPALRKFLYGLKGLEDLARELGVFVNDRELVECPRCGLIEDVAFGGKLISYRADDPSMTDTGLRFTFQGETCRCPSCGHEFTVEEPEDSIV
jgi:hypothetical protein